LKNATPLLKTLKIGYVHENLDTFLECVVFIRIHCKCLSL